MNVRSSILELLEAGADDWVDASQLASIVTSTGGTESPHACRTLALRVVERVVLRGMMIVGDLTGSGGRFTPWQGTGDAVVRRVASGWPDDRLPSLSETCWLCNTHEGDRIGGSLAAIWNSPRRPEELLSMRAGVYGCIALDWIEWFVDRHRIRPKHAQAESSTRLAALALAETAVRTNLLQPGDLKGGNFCAWGESGTAGLHRLRDAWTSSMVEPSKLALGLTSAGQLVSERLCRETGVDQLIASL